MAMQEGWPKRKQSIQLLGGKEAADVQHAMEMYDLSYFFVCLLVCLFGRLFIC